MSSAASPWYAAWPPHPPEGDEACPTCGYGLDDGSGTEHECPPGYRDQAAATTLRWEDSGGCIVVAASDYDELQDVLYSATRAFAQYALDTDNPPHEAVLDFIEGFRQDARLRRTPA